MSDIKDAMTKIRKLLITGILYPIILVPGIIVIALGLVLMPFYLAWIILSGSEDEEAEPIPTPKDRPPPPPRPSKFQQRLEEKMKEKATERRKPMQPIKDARFVANEIVRYLLDNGGITLNDLALLPFTQEDREQFYQLIGYSVSGYCDLDVSDESAEEALRKAGGG